MFLLGLDVATSVLRRWYPPCVPQGLHNENDSGGDLSYKKLNDKRFFVTFLFLLVPACAGDDDDYMITVQDVRPTCELEERRREKSRGGETTYVEQPVQVVDH